MLEIFATARPVAILTLALVIQAAGQEITPKAQLLPAAGPPGRAVPIEIAVFDILPPPDGVALVGATALLGYPESQLQFNADDCEIFPALDGMYTYTASDEGSGVIRIEVAPSGPLDDVDPLATGDLGRCIFETTESATPGTYDLTLDAVSFLDESGNTVVGEGLGAPLRIATPEPPLTVGVTGTSVKIDAAELVDLDENLASTEISLLTDNAREAYGVSLTIRFDPNLAPMDLFDCFPNDPALGNGSGVRRYRIGGSMPTESTIQLSLTADEYTGPLPVTTFFITCKWPIAPDQPLGFVPIQVTDLEVVDIDGQPLVAEPVPGGVEIIEFETTSEPGCAVGAARPHGAAQSLAWLAPPLLLLLSRRIERRRRS